MVVDFIISHGFRATLK